MYRLWICCLLAIILIRVKLSSAQHRVELQQVHGVFGRAAVLRCRVFPKHTKLKYILWRGPKFTLMYGHHFLEKDWSRPSAKYTARKIRTIWNLRGGYMDLVLPNPKELDEGHYVCEAFDRTSKYAISSKLYLKLARSGIRDNIPEIRTDGEAIANASCHGNLKLPTYRRSCQTQNMNYSCHINFAMPGSRMEWTIQFHHRSEAYPEKYILSESQKSKNVENMYESLSSFIMLDHKLISSFTLKCSLVANVTWVKHTRKFKTCLHVPACTSKKQQSGSNHGPQGVPVGVTLLFICAVVISMSI